MRKILALAALAATAFLMNAQEIPQDPGVRTGTLANGLTYYVKHNSYPEHRADFFIAQRVGSIQEEENQRGLAHFLEHMCFNGTKHFPGNSLVSYLELNGVKFGTNLNAYTSTDETVYNICNVPTQRKGLLDSCLLILSDWSHDLSLNGTEIDKERGVIEGEYRYRSGANYRLLEKALPELYPDNLYGHRMPIGLMSVVKSFKHKTLRNYYKKWYHPANQCVIVVGDIDPDAVVAQINVLFGQVKANKKQAEAMAVSVPDNEQILTSVQTDPEQPTTSVRLLFKHGDLPDPLKNTTAGLRHTYLNYAVTHMLRNRFSELSLLPDAPFTHVGVTDRDFMISKTRQALQLTAVSRTGQADSTMRWLSREVHRASLYGFTTGEARRARLSYESALDKLYRERGRYTNTQYARDFVDCYLNGEPVPSIDVYYELMKKEVAQVSLADLNAHFNSMVSTTERNVALVAFAPENNDFTLTNADLVSAFRQGREDKVEAYLDTIGQSRLLPEEPQPGHIVFTQTIPELDATLWTLDNGMHVYVKHSQLKPGEVVIAGAGPGGLSQNYRGASDAPSFKAISNVMSQSGYGAFSSNELKKFLTGKEVKVSTFINKTEEGFQASSTKNDLAIAFQLLYLKLTSPQKDEASFATYLKNTRNHIENQGSDPKFEFADSIFAHVFRHHPLGAERLSLTEIDQVDYDRIMEVYKDRFSDMSDINMFVVGDFNEDTLRTLVCRYVASLPAGGRMEHPKDIGYGLYDRMVDVRWTRHMENPQDKLYFFWTTEFDYNLRNNLVAKITGQLFTNLLRQQLREDRGWTYHVDTHCAVVADLNGDAPAVIFMPLNVTLEKGTAEQARAIITEDIRSKADDGFTQEELDKVKKYLRKVHQEDIRENGYWMTVLRIYDKHGQNHASTYEQTLDGITTEDIRQFIATHLANARVLNLTMTPQ